MTRAILMGTTGIAVAFSMLAFGYLAGQTREAVAQDNPQVIQAADAGLDKAEVEKIVREYLLANPEIIVEMQKILDDRERDAQRVAQIEAIRKAKEEIFNAGYDGVVGNPEGKVTIVEFYDYNCGYCKRAQDDMLALTAADPDLRFVLKEFPILGPDSTKAHVVSMAFRELMPEKFEEFHNRLLGAPGRAGEASALKIALELGVDEARLREAMKNPSIQESFAKTYELAQALAITGTPSYVVGTEVVFGALGEEVLAGKISEARTCILAQTC